MGRRGIAVGYGERARIGQLVNWSYHGVALRFAHVGRGPQSLRSLLLRSLLMRSRGPGGREKSRADRGRNGMTGDDGG